MPPMVIHNDVRQHEQRHHGADSRMHPRGAVAPYTTVIPATGDDRDDRSERLPR